MFLSDIANFNRSQLSSTTTVERNLPCVSQSNYSRQNERDMTEYYVIQINFEKKLKNWQN